jgi:hypothetical protein
MAARLAASCFIAPLPPATKETTMHPSITTLHRLGLVARCALLCAAATAAGTVSASVTRGVSFGTLVDAGGLKQGGDYQSAASVNRTSSDGNTQAVGIGSSEYFLLKALAWTTETPTLPSYCTVYTCSWSTSSTVTVWDTITLTAPEGSSESFNFNFDIDGTKKRGRWAYGDGAYASASYYFGTDDKGWHSAPRIQLRSGETSISGTLTARPGTSFPVYLMASLSVSATSGAVADYSHTMTFSWDLPAGWTYTSASGVFSPAVTAVPEPGRMAMLAAGLMGLAAVKRRRINAP